MLKRLVKQQKHYLSLARESFKNRGSIKRKQRLEIFVKNGRFLAKMKGLESLMVKPKFGPLSGVGGDDQLIDTVNLC